MPKKGTRKKAAVNMEERTPIKEIAIGALTGTFLLTTIGLRVVELIDMVQKYREKEKKC